ncbi:MAG TPA: molecular chaperone TorD family protein [Candidatus Methylomirabilis sp.]
MARGMGATLKAVQGEVEIALCRSALYEALVLGFRPPTAEAVARLAAAEGAEALADAATVLDAAWGTGLAGLIRRLPASPPPLTLGSLAADYRRLFGHTARGLVPPYETEYGEDSPFLPAQEMGDLAGFYRAFGLVVRPDEHERIDHICCACEFLLFLARKEAYALERDQKALRADIRMGARLFLRDHLGRFAPAFGKRLAREDPDGFYGALGDLCAAFVAHECARAGVPAGPEFLRLRSPSDGDAPMACGTGQDAELLQISGLSSGDSSA